MVTDRRPDIDWLRIFATYLLFAFHAGKVFDPAPFYHIRNDDVSFVMMILCGFVSLWHMPLFFLLAGWSAAAALRRRGAGGFVRERVLRLVVPLVVGSALFGPVLKYLELRSGQDLNHAGLRLSAELQVGIRQFIPGGLPLAPPFDEGFLTFLPTFFTDLDRFTWSHLWFLAYLFALSVIWLPVLTRLTRRSRSKEPAAHTPHAFILYLPIGVLALIQLTMRERWPGIYNLYDDWANVAYYSVFFLGGAVLATRAAVGVLVEREWKRSLALASAATLILLGAVLSGAAPPAVMLVGVAVAGWCFVLAMLGWARGAFRSTSPALGYLSESALPVYILHQAAITIPGYFLLQLTWGIPAKFSVLVFVSLALTMAVYHWLLRPFAVPRFLLGMRTNARGSRRAIMTARPATASVVALLSILCAGPVVAATPVGLWYAEGGAAQVAVEPCGDRLCGRVVWLRSPFDEDGCELRDHNNPDSGLRDRLVAGLEILRDLSPRADGAWSGGKIYDPGSGRVYACTLALEGENRLLLRGYVGIPLLGRTTTWIRVGAKRRVCGRSSDEGYARSGW